jgi:hypothetical protein
VACSVIISCGSSGIIGMMVMVSFFGGLRCVFSVLFWSPMQYMHQPMMNMNASAGRRSIIRALLRLRLLFNVPIIAPDYSSVVGEISFDYFE